MSQESVYKALRKRRWIKAKDIAASKEIYRIDIRINRISWVSIYVVGFASIHKAGQPFVEQ